MQQSKEKILKMFEQQNGLDIDTVLLPVDDDDPAGPSLFNNGVYQKIADARKEDDDTTPRGVWEYDTQHADWNLVYDTSLEAITEKSKDVQLAAWLLEAQLWRIGFSAIAPGMLLIHELFENFWDSVHPQMEEGDFEHRVNIISWINVKLAPVLRQIPISDRPDADTQYSWGDWEMAQHHAHILSAHPDTKGLENELDVDTVILNITQTPVEFYQKLYSDLELGLNAIDQLVSFLDEKCGISAPSMSEFAKVMEDIAGMAYSQLEQRGVIRMMAASGSDDDEIEDGSGGGVGFAGPPSDDPVQNRNDAYAALRQIADYLVVDDPHSPAPYLVYKAIDWGHMNTAQLYNELFVEQQGQLNIFEVLGIKAAPNQQ